MPSPLSPQRQRHRTLRWVLLAKAGAGVALTLGLLGGWWLRANGLSVDEAVQEFRRAPTDPPRFEWRSVDKKHWQAVAKGEGEPAALTDVREGNSAGCPSGMVRVRGSYRLELHGEATGEIERLQDAACTDWISRDFPARCRSFDRERIAQEIAKLPARTMDYCMDRFEYPNVLGQYPIVVVTFNEADAMCRRSSKRLCSENEWTFACEGEEVRPYPYGWTRDATSCVIDRAWRPFTEGALSPRDAPRARDELDRLWQGEPSGSRGGCKSPFGVYDMTGNVDEWTRSVKSSGYRSVLKGGYWGPVRARCRPATRAHNEEFVAYQQSFRCCADANTQVPAPPPTPPVAVLADAGPAPAGPDGGPQKLAADLDPEYGYDRREPGDDDDELGAIKRAALGLQCVASPSAPRAPAGAPVVVAAAALVLVAARRRSR